MLSAARDGREISTAARCLLALMGHDDPSPEQVAGARLLAFGLDDLHLIARAHSKE